MHNVVLIHGFWHGSWCWSPVTQQLAGRGITAAAIDIDGSGLKLQSPSARWGRPFDAAAFAAEPSAAAEVTATSAARALIGQIEAIGGGDPCVIVAHSAGGTVATLAAELAPSLFAHLVYVAGFAPVSGKSSASYTFLPECADSLVARLQVGDPTVTGALRIDTGDRRAEVRETFYGDVDDVTADAAMSLLTPDAPLAMAMEEFTVTRDRYGSIPHTYVACAKDRVMPPALQRLFINEIDAVSSSPTKVVDFDSAHSPFLSQPSALADVIASV